MAISKHPVKLFEVVVANGKQDIAPVYFDLSTFKNGEVKIALQRTVDKIRRKEAMKVGSREKSRK
jgi:pre-mRNA-splicing factor ATP-dependent RNA helicase DHX15/PRP43